MTNIISDLSNSTHKLHSSSAPDAAAKLEEGKAIISKVSALKSQMGKNAILESVSPFIQPGRSRLLIACRPLEDDGGGNIKCYNDELATFAEEDKRWFTMNWLFAECYLYVPFFPLSAGTQVGQVPAITDLFCPNEPLEELRPILRVEGRDVQVEFWSYHPSDLLMIFEMSSLTRTDLSQAINKMVETENLADGHEKPGSALEIAFLSVFGIYLVHQSLTQSERWYRLICGGTPRSVHYPVARSRAGSLFRICPSSSTSSTRICKSSKRSGQKHKRSRPSSYCETTCRRCGIISRPSKMVGWTS